MWWLLACASPEPAPPVAPPPPPPREARARAAVLRAVGWMEAHADEPRAKLDVPIGLAAITRRLPSPEAEALRDRLTAVHDRLGDPRRRLYDEAHRLADPPPPAIGPDGKTNTNAALVQALYCREHPIRPETLAAVCGPLRDGGGYGSTHAAWILAEGIDRGCVAREATCADLVQAELLATAVPPPPLPATLDRDLLGERVLFALRLGASPEALAPAIDALLAAQGPDGGFGVPAEGEPSWWAWHAALSCTWALAEWVARREGR